MNEEITAATAKNRSDARWRLRHGFDNILGQPSLHPRVDVAGPAGDSTSVSIVEHDLYGSPFKIRDVFHLRPRL